MLNTVNFLFALLILVFMVGNAFARRAEGHRSASTIAFVLAAFALVVCLWNYALLKGASAPSAGYPSGDAVRILTRLDSLDAHVRSLRQDIDVVQRRMWYLSKGHEPQVDSLRAASSSE